MSIISFKSIDARNKAWQKAGNDRGFSMHGGLIGAHFSGPTSISFPNASERVLKLVFKNGKISYSSPNLF